MPKPVVLPPPTQVLKPNTETTAGVVLHILASFSWISALGAAAFPGEDVSEHLFLLKWSVGHELPGADSSVPIMMAANLQAARKEKSSIFSVVNDQFKFSISLKSGT